MKATTLLLFFFAGGVFLSTFSSCENDSWKKKYDSLSQENQALKDSIAHYSGLPDTNSLSGALSILLDSTQRNKFLSTLQIISFDRKTLLSTLSHFDNDSFKVIYFIAYPDSVTGKDPSALVASQYLENPASGNTCPTVCRNTQ